MKSNQKNPIIRLLTPAQDSDVPQLLEIFADEVTKHFLPELTEVIREEEDIRFFLQNITRAQASGDAVLWGIRLDSHLIGLIGIIDIPESPSMFYAMHPNHRGKGIMTECVAEAVEWFHANHPTLPLHTEVYKENVPSIHLLQKNNFTKFNEDEQKIFMKVVSTTDHSD